MGEVKVVHADRHQVLSHVSAVLVQDFHELHVLRVVDPAHGAEQQRGRYDAADASEHTAHGLHLVNSVQTTAVKVHQEERGGVDA